MGTIELMLHVNLKREKKKRAEGADSAKEQRGVTMPL